MVDDRGSPKNARSGVAAAAIGAVLPGLGHGYLGRWGRAAAMSLPTIALGAILVVALRMPRFDLLGILVSPAVLRGVLVANIVIVVWRIFAVTDPYRLSRDEHNPWTWVTVLLLAFLVAVPHVVIAKYTLDAAYALDQVFVTGDISPMALLDDPASVDEPLQGLDSTMLEVADPATAPVPAPRSRPPRSLLFTDGVGDPAAVGTPTRGPGSVRWDLGTLLGSDYDGVSRITILLVGGDGGPGRSGNRSDSIMVATFDTDTGKSVVFGIPRNMTHVPLPSEWSTAFIDLEKRLTPFEVRKQWTDEDGDGEPDQFEPCHCFPDQINALYPFTRKWVDTYPNEIDPGLAALRDTLEILLGLKIDYYAMVNMSGFVRLVDALGGVRAYVTSHVVTEVSPAREGEEWIEIDLEPGWHRLNGHEALAYVRERKSVSDYTRMKRQRCLLKAVAAQIEPATVVRRFSAISRAFASSVRTDIPREFLPGLLRRGSSLDLGDIATIGFVPPFYTSVLDHRGKPTPDLLRIHAIVRWALSAESDTEFDTGRDSECRI
ncbi:MAG: LCP family protein [Acidimicrobiia bacterium]